MLTNVGGARTWAVVVALVLTGAWRCGAQYGGGTGAWDDPYLIYTAEQMHALGAHPADWNSHFRLMADIDLAAYTAASFHIIDHFTGTFDGNGHTISNFTYAAVGGGYVGLFGYTEGVVIKDLGLINPRVTVSGGSNVGALVGYLRGTVINGCYVQGGTVTGAANVGGLVGQSYQGVILNCYSTTAVKGTGRVAGGLIGQNSAGSLDNCYARGAVDGTDYVGGLAGSNGGPVTACYAAAKVTGSAWTSGGLIASNSGKVTASFWDTQASGQRNNSGTATGVTSAQMRNQQTFMAAGWDFFGPADGPSDIWTMDATTGYPILWWQVPRNQLPALPSFAGGSGTSADPYRIASAQQLNSIGHNPRLMAGSFQLVGDIDLAGTTFVAISSNLFPFTGDFDGNNRTISNLMISAKNASLVGLFSYVAGARARVRNLILVNPNINVASGESIGSLVGELDDGMVRNCRVQGAHVAGTGDVGGLVGENFGTIRDCRAEAVVTGYGDLGGLVGWNFGTLANSQASGTVAGSGYDIGGVAGNGCGIIANCSASCTVTGGDATGGIVGFFASNEGEGVINCYVSGGSVSGTSEVGGLIGSLNNGNVWNCYSICRVSGKSRVGGLIGSVQIGAVTSSFWNVQTSGQAASAGGVSKTSTQMADPNTFMLAGWDFFGPINGPSDIWTFDSTAHRPVLWWQVPESQWPALPGFAGGAGTPDDPYLIDSAARLISIGHNPRLMECSFKLIRDIDLTGLTFSPIGGLAAPFSATFDGGNHTVTHCAYAQTAGSYLGFLGYVAGADAQIRDLTLSEPDIQGGKFPTGDGVGALVGCLTRGSLRHCTVGGGSVSGSEYTGHLVGLVLYGTIRDCQTTGTTTGWSEIGGLVGYASHSTIMDCQAQGPVTATGPAVGGLVGQTGETTIRTCCATGAVTGAGGTGGLVGSMGGAITDCYATGDVSGGVQTGGLVGSSYYILTDSHATGKVTGKDEVGGLTGVELGDVQDCYATGTVTGNSSVGGLVGGNLGSIDHSHADGAVTGKQHVGALVGENDEGGALIDCYASGPVSGQDGTGGLAGRNTCGSTVARCRATGLVSGQIAVGGLVGYNDDTAAINDCYATGAVSGGQNVGGLVGQNGGVSITDSQHQGLPCVIAHCYSSGHVSGSKQAGGLIGSYVKGSVLASFWDVQTSGQAASVRGAGKTTAEMWAARTFINAGWDFAGETQNGTADLWWIREAQGYPQLRWEQSPHVP